MGILSLTHSGTMNSYLPRSIFLSLQLFIGAVVQVSAQDIHTRIDLTELSLEELVSVYVNSRDSSETGQDQYELTSKLLDWLTHRTSLTYNSDQVPEVMRASNEELVEIAFSKNVPLAADMSKTSIYGLYNFKSNMIVLRDDIDLKTPEGKAIFLHELVHYLQYQNNINLDVKSVNELESLAYMLESRYLSESDWY